MKGQPTMRTAIILATLLSAVGCAGRVATPSTPAATVGGWVDFDRVAAKSALGKRLADEHRIVIRSRQDELDKISAQLSAAEKAKDKQLDQMRAVAQQKRAVFEAEIKQHDDQATAQLREAIKPIAAVLAEERHLARVDFEQHLWAIGDLTDEVIRRLDAATYEATKPPAPPAQLKGNRP